MSRLTATPSLHTALRGLFCVIAMVLVGSTAIAAPTLVSIGPDADGVGRTFVPIGPADSGTLLGDGSLAFNGGLAYRPVSDTTYAIANDSLGASSLASFSANHPAGPLSLVSIGTGFLGGLAYDAGSDAFYAIASDASAFSTLYRLDASGSAVSIGGLGFGFFGGLTFDSSDGLLYAIAGDDFGVHRRVERIDPLAATVAATTLFDLGTGDTAFNGGLLYDGVADRFLTIGNDFAANSRLYAFDAAGALTDLADPIGSGFLNVGLALVDLDATGEGGNPTVPEPPTLALMAVALFMTARTRAARASTASAVARLSRRNR